MKLLFCERCGDVVKLRRDYRSCECGHVGGKYLSDGWHAEVSADAVVLGVANDTMRRALEAFKAGSDDSGHRTLSAWVMGADAPRVKWEAKP